MKPRNRNNGAAATRPADRDEMARVINAAWLSGLLPRKKTCAKLRLDQGQFSKIVNGKFARPIGHAASLFAYAKMQIDGAPETSEEERSAAAERLVQVVLATWDKTEAGAQALSTAIQAIGRLQEVSKHRQ